MTCEEARRLILSHIDPPNEAAPNATLTAHLESCKACRARLEAERRIERAIADRLRRDTLPDADWRRIEAAVRRSQPVGGWSRWPMYGAAAAVLLLLTWRVSVAMLGLGPSHLNKGGESGTKVITASNPGRQIVRRYLDEATGDAAFKPQANAATALPFSNLGFDLSPRSMGYHPAELISVAEKPGPDGTILEIRLNCCGQPVLMLVAPRSKPGALADVATALHTESEFAYREDGVNVAGRGLGEYVVLAASRHTVTPLIGALIHH